MKRIMTSNRMAHRGQIGQILAGVALAAGLALSAPLAVAQSAYPNKPIRIITPYPAGGGADTMARILGPWIHGRTGQPVIVESRSGAGGNIGAEAVWRADPDGYTLMMSPHPPYVVNKYLYTKLAYDPDTFTPISVLTTTFSQLLVHPKVPSNTLKEFITYARNNSGKLNYASQGVGNSAHLSAELFNAMAGVKVVHIPYKGTAPAVADLLAGQVEMMIVDGATAEPHVRAGKLKVLGVGSERRQPDMPHIPAIAEELPGYRAQTWLGVVAPPNTPPALANEISLLFTTALKDPEVLARIARLRYTIMATNPADMATFMQQERKRWGDVIRATGAKAE